jgi:hypothetical protein
MLCAWCPSVAAEISGSVKSRLKTHEGTLLRLHLAGKLPAGEVKASLEALRPAREQIDGLAHALQSGEPMTSKVENMDFYNSLQCGEAFRYVVCQRSDFALAKRHNGEFPQLRKGRQFTI